MKTCRKCHEPKPESEFYKRAHTPDCLDYWCKGCRIADTHQRRGTNKLAPSTETAIILLSQNGIPATMGYITGHPGKDVVAYGYLTIEAKSACSQRKNGGYTFGLTKYQAVERCDYYVLIFTDVNRVFVIPGNVLSLKSCIYINIDDPHLKKYENAFDIIKDRVMNDITANLPIHSVKVLSGAKAYAVSC